jgi:hypothetical protein
MKVWKVQETIVNDDKALELELNRLEHTGAKIKEVILAERFQSCKLPIVYTYKIIYTIEDIVEE